MRVSVHFNGQGLELYLRAETEPEKKMIGAVLNQPAAESGFRPHEIDTALLTATVSYDGHWSNKVVTSLALRVHRQESSVRDGDNDAG